MKRAVQTGVRWLMVASVVATIVSVPSFPADASYLESDFPDGRKKPEPRPPDVIPPRPIPRPPPRRDSEITDLLDSVRVLNGYHYRGLTVFPVELRWVRDNSSYASMDEALSGGYLTVTERGNGVVSELVMENRGGHYVFILGGDVVTGGKQNRTVREDVLLPPRSGPVVIPTYCVEKDRWSGGGGPFRSGGTVSHLSLRRKAQARAPQAEIWSDIKERLNDVEASSPTQDFQALYRSKKAARELEGYRDHYRRIWPRRVAGMVVARGHSIVGADICCNSALFSKLRHKLLDSYAFDVICRPEKYRRHPSRRDAEAFLKQVYRAHYSSRNSPGAGVLVDITGNGVRGTSLIFRQAVTHLSVFPERYVPIRPLER